MQNIPKNMGCPRQPCPHQRGGAQMDPRSGHIAPRSRSAPLPLPGGGARSRRGGAAPGVHERAPFFLLLSKRGATTATRDCTTEEKAQKGQQGNVRGKTESRVLIQPPHPPHSPSARAYSITGSACAIRIQLQNPVCRRAVPI